MKSRRKVTVLFTACCGWPTCGTIDTLRRSKDLDFKVIGVDCSPNPAAANYVDVLCKVPRYDDKDYIPELLRICKANGVELVIPLISDEIDIISLHRDEFEKNGIKVSLSGNKDKLDIANNKYKLMQFLESRNLFYMPNAIKVNKDNWEDALRALGYPARPVCIKRVDGCGASGFRIIDDEMARKSVFARTRDLRANKYTSKAQVELAIDDIGDDFMLQEHVSGTEGSTICLVDHGRTVYAVTHKNMKMEFATSTYCELVKSDEANNIVKKLNEMFELDGNIGYDFIRREDGKLFLLEINPRISATVSLAAKAGLNLVELGVKHALGMKIDENIVPEYGMRLMRNYGTLYEKDGVPRGRW